MRFRKNSRWRRWRDVLWQTVPQSGSGDWKSSIADGWKTVASYSNQLWRSGTETLMGLGICLNTFHCRPSRIVYSGWHIKQWKISSPFIVNRVYVWNVRRPQVWKTGTIRASVSCWMSEGTLSREHDVMSELRRFRCGCLKSEPSWYKWSYVENGTRLWF